MRAVRTAASRCKMISIVPWMPTVMPCNAVCYVGGRARASCCVEQCDMHSFKHNFFFLIIFFKAGKGKKTHWHRDTQTTTRGRFRNHKPALVFSKVEGRNKIAKIKLQRTLKVAVVFCTVTEEVQYLHENYCACARKMGCVILPVPQKIKSE